MAPSKPWMTDAALSPARASRPAISFAVTTVQRAGTPEAKEHLPTSQLTPAHEVLGGSTTLISHSTR